MEIKVEIELNRAWIYDNVGEVIGETNFVVDGKWLRDLFDKYYWNEYSDFEEFLEVYEPEIEGEFIYQKAIENKALIEDSNVFIY